MDCCGLCKNDVDGLLFSRPTTTTTNPFAPVSTAASAAAAVVPFQKTTTAMMTILGALRFALEYLIIGING
jgi:hypothetical protein